MRSTACVLLVLGTACADDGAPSEEPAGSTSTSAPSSRGSSGLATETGLAAGSGESRGSTRGDTGTGEEQAMVRLPEPDASFDYQLGGAYEPPAGVTVLVRDRTAPPAPGLYNVCYVNGFQTQPHEEDWWLDEHPDLLLRDEAGELVIDPAWQEILLDIRTDANREALATLVGTWIEQCASDGFAAVEIDNLDTYARSGGLIAPDDAVAYMRLLSARAHDAGLAIAQKNAAELLDHLDELGTDFVVAEECNVYDECQDYRDLYGDLVFVIEYERSAFEAGCSTFPDLSIVLRDLDLVTPTDAGYVYEGC